MIFLKAIFQLLLIIAAAPLLTGIIRKIKALTQHRKGMPVLQQYYDIFKLFRKDTVIPAASSWIFTAAPYVYLVTALMAAVMIPAVPQLFSFSFMGDAILAIYVLALGRFFITLAGLDAGSSFGGMGSSRELMISSMIEPSLIVALLTTGMNQGAISTNLRDMYAGSVQLGFDIFSPVNMLLLAAFIIILISETARIPVDDPATHLELTMVHEAMILEYSGKYLAMIHLASSVKQLVFITLICNLFLPAGSIMAQGAYAAAVSLGAFALKVFAVTLVAALIEINSVKLKLFSVPNLAALAFILSMLGFMSGFVFGR